MFCSIPFTTLCILPSSCATCCPAWLDGAGITKSQSPWNSKEFVELRKSILDGSFKYCQNCPRVFTQNCNDIKKHHYHSHMLRSPQRLSIGNDLTCNLKCWSCRKRFITQSNVNMSLVYQFLPFAEFMSISSNGDPFASPTHRDFLTSLSFDYYPKLKIEIFTNGLLLPQYWDDLINIHKNIKIIRMSIDAASKEIYEKIRCGGKWEKLILALEFISNLKQTNQINQFITHFCIQKDNYKEAPEFVDLMLKYNVTRVVFNLLRRKWHSIEEFQKKSILDLDEIINDKRMSHSKVVSPFLTEQGRKIVENDCLT